MENMQQEAQVHNIYNLNGTQKFSEDQAYELVNLFIAITKKAKNTIQGFNSQLEYHKAMPQQADAIQVRLNREISKWSDKIKRLGGVPLALFKVKIPGVSGFYIWEYPSADIEHHF